eukprot:3301603-Pyramimonas_sp.AAC.1
MGFRERDPPRSLPTPTGPLAARGPSSVLSADQLRLTWLRTCRAVRALRSLAAGRVGAAEGAAVPTSRGRGGATGLQRKVVYDIWDRHARPGARGASATRGASPLAGADCSGYAAGGGRGMKQTTSST